MGEIDMVVVFILAMITTVAYLADLFVCYWTDFRNTQDKGWYFDREHYNRRLIFAALLIIADYVLLIFANN